MLHTLFIITKYILPKSSLICQVSFHFFKCLGNVNIYLCKNRKVFIFSILHSFMVHFLSILPFCGTTKRLPECQPNLLYNSFILSNQCHQFPLELFFCCMVSKEPTGVVVDPVLYIRNLFWGLIIKIAPFGNLPANHLIGTFVRASLPATVSMAIIQVCPLSAK